MNTEQTSKIIFMYNIIIFETFKNEIKKYIKFPW